MSYKSTLHAFLRCVNSKKIMVRIKVYDRIIGIICIKIMKIVFNRYINLYKRIHCIVILFRYEFIYHPHTHTHTHEILIIFIRYIS